MFNRYEPTLRKKTTPQSETQLGLSQPRHQVLGMAFNRIQRALLHCHCRSLDFPQSPPWLNPEHHRVRAGHGIPRASLLLTIGTSKGQLKWICSSKAPNANSTISNPSTMQAAGPWAPSRSCSNAHNKAVCCCPSRQSSRCLLCLAFDPFMQQIVSYPVRRGSKLDGKSDHQAGHGPCCHSSLLHSAPMTMTFSTP